MANVTLQDLQAGTVFYPQTTVEQVIGLGDQLGSFATTEALEGAVGDINDSIDEINTTIEGLATKEELEQGLDDLKGEILGDDLEETFNTLKEVQEWADKHGTEYASLLETVNGLETDVEKIKKDIEDLAGGEDLEALESRVGQLETDIADKADQSDLDTLDGRVDALETSVGQLESDIADKVDTSDYESKIEEVEAAATALEARVKALEDAKKSNVWAAVAE